MNPIGADNLAETDSNYPSIASSHAKGSNVEIFTFDGPDDRRCPYNWSNTRKWLVASIALLGTLVLPLNGTSITVAADEINAEFGVSDTDTFTNSYWTVTSWTLGGAVFIIVGLPLMEDIGVRIGYLISYVCFFLMVIPQAVAQNFATLVVTRFFSGGFVALLANTIASMIPDLWETDAERSLPVGLYILFFLVSSTIGPPLFAGVVQFVNWRWIFYIQLIVYGALFPLFAYFVEETRHHIILRKLAKTARKETGRNLKSQAEVDDVKLSSFMYESITRPGKLLFTEPVLMCCTLWSAFSFGTVFFFTQSVEQVFYGLYGWTEYQCGYVQAAVVIGEIFGWLASVYGSHLFLKSADRNTESPGRPIPEARLYVSVFGSFVGITGGMFVYAWTSYPYIHWIAPTIGLGMVGFGILTVVSAVADYVTDAYADSGKNGSAISAVAAGEDVVAGLLPLATQSMYRSLGFNWASTLLGLIALVISFAPVVFIWKGQQLRRKSPFMNSGGAYDLGKGRKSEETKSEMTEYSNGINV